MKKNGHRGKESGERSILLPSSGSGTVSEQVGEVWIRKQSKWQPQDEQAVDAVLEGECCGDGDQVVQMNGFFLPPRLPSLQLVPPLSFYALRLQLPFSYLKLPLFPSAFDHPTPLKLP